MPTGTRSNARNARRGVAGKTKTAGREHLLHALNPRQREAVLHTDGPVLILAGAGSGKTRVLTHRVAYLIEVKGVKPWNILAVTFTNKAAGEMKDRLSKLTQGHSKDVWIGTFHSICARILRREAERIGFGRNFVILDREDQLRFIKAVMENLNIPAKDYPPQVIRARISGAKNTFIGPDEYNAAAQDHFEDTTAMVYVEYQKRLKDNNAMDFDDLLVKPIRLFEQYPVVLSNYQNRFHYILVDEYQDTNRTQYLLLQMLSARHGNLCVVGDDDQSIYRWRGADIRNILDFEEDYKDCKIFHLDQNYRSTKCILDAAHSVVRNNFQRREKKLWTDKEPGEKVLLLELPDARTEARIVVELIKEELHRHARNFADFAVLYRTNAQSRILEDLLRVHGIPYVIVGGLRFYERKEVKDVIAYLRLICNPNDSMSFKRVVNDPPRGIGDTSIKRLEEFAAEQGISLFEAAGRIEEVTAISARIRSSIQEFHDLVNKYASLRGEFSPGELVRALVDEIGMAKSFKEIGTEEALGRLENVRELQSGLDQYFREHPDHTLDDFLEEVALITDVDTWDRRSNSVTLMTLHSAKGLEFPVVFITGLEEGLFPLSRTFDDLRELEEERRLFYVGCTRARQKLYLTWAAMRPRFSENKYGMASRFLKEIDAQYLEKRTFRTPPRSASAYEESFEPAPSYEDYSQEVPELTHGSQVRHPKFGVGTVKNLEGRGENLRIVVDFLEEGRKKLVVKYANLEILT